MFFRNMSGFSFAIYAKRLEKEIPEMPAAQDDGAYSIGRQQFLLIFRGIFLKQVRYWNGTFINQG